MTIIFTEQELEWIEKEPLNWHPKDGCPKNIKDSLEKKIKLLNSETKDLRELAMHR